VTWSMQGPVPYLAKILHIFINMDRMVGPGSPPRPRPPRAAAPGGGG